MSPNELVSTAGLIAILSMTAMTYLMRVAGFWLMGHVPITARVRRMLEALPGSVVVAIVLPAAMKAGASAFVGLAAVIAVMIASRSQFLAVAAGVGVVALVRAFGI